MLLFIIILFVYLIMMFITFKMIKNDKLDLNKITKVKLIFFNPIYLITYIYCALKALFTKNVYWDKIDHKVNKK